MGLGILDLVVQWGPQALRKCILGWIRGRRSPRYIRNILEKISKNQVGGGSKVTLVPPPIWMSVKDKKDAACKEKWRKLRECQENLDIEKCG